MTEDEYFMQKALEEAEVAFEEDEIPVGAIITIDNTIIARAHKMTERLNDVTAHAEMQAITMAANYLGGKYLKDCTMYLTLEPCAMCAGALYWSQLSRLVYAAADTHRGYTVMGGTLLPNTDITSGVLAAPATELLKQFFQQKRKR